jgi:ribosomal protein S27AE
MEGYAITIETLPKQCPRCRGRVLVEHDYYGAFGTCMTCGYVSEARDASPADMLAAERLEAQRRGLPARRGPRRRTMPIPQSELRG